MKKIILGFIFGCVLTISITANAAEISGQLTKIYDSLTGGKIEVYDASNGINARLGSESGSGDNTGGTLMLYNHSINKPRIALGTLSAEDTGVFEALDKNNNVRIQIQATNKKYGDLAFIGIRNESKVMKTYLTEEYGYINGKKVITQDYLEENYVSKSEVQKMIDEAIKEALGK
jgi:hypothetical protein